MNSTARSRTGRHAAIAKLINGQDFTSQEQLREALAVAGISTTQATLSRDLLDMGATKVRTPEGRNAYRLPDMNAGHPTDVTDSLLARRCSDLLASAESVLNQVVIHTPPGAAQLLAVALDRGSAPSVLGCVAGDDTVLVICRGEAEAQALQARLLRLAGRTE